MKIAECSRNGKKTVWVKEKLLCTSKFSFSRSVFKRLVLQIRKNKGLFGKGLNSGLCGQGLTRCPNFKLFCLETTLSNVFNSFPKRQILDSSKFKEFADHNFLFNENGRTLSKLVENTVGKVEIAGYEQFLLFLQLTH